LNLQSQWDRLSFPLLEKAGPKLFIISFWARLFPKKARSRPAHYQVARNADILDGMPSKALCDLSERM
jgi:hypothetical protein